jgi:hypothetical protein
MLLPHPSPVVSVGRIQLAVAAAKASIATAGLADYNMTNVTAFEEAKNLSRWQVAVTEMGIASTYSHLLGVKDFEFDVGNHSSVVEWNCPLNGSLPLKLVEYCCKESDANCVDMDSGCSDPYQAYTRWCNPVICYNITAKNKYMITMQAASAIGGLYGLFMLVFVSILWRICLACCRPHWKPPVASTAAAAAAAGEGANQSPGSPIDSQDMTSAAEGKSGFAASVRRMSLQLSGVSHISNASNSALSNAHAPLTPAVSSVTPLLPMPQPSTQVNIAERDGSATV